MQKAGEENRATKMPQERQACWELWFCTALTLAALGIAVWIVSDVSEQRRMPGYAMLRPP